VRAFRVAYDGRPFHGFQRQPDVPTVEDTVLGALRSLSVLAADADTPPGYAAAGRTDAGVSALAQTVAFECPDWLTPRALNSELPGTVRAWASADVDADFHATHDASHRTYVYYLYAPRAAADAQRSSRSPPPGGQPTVDDDRAAAALDALCGPQDFHNLTPDSRGTERELSGRLDREGDFLVLTVTAGGFARELVRRLVSVLRSVATRDRSLAWLEELLGDDPVDPRPAPAAPEPLVLSAVAYPGVDFERDPEAAASAAAAFGERAIAARTAGRVSTAITDGVVDGDH
jgi:tRNA pseudouridine38-40 synthase